MKRKNRWGQPPADKLNSAAKPENDESEKNVVNSTSSQDENNSVKSTQDNEHVRFHVLILLLISKILRDSVNIFCLSM